MAARASLAASNGYVSYSARTFASTASATNSSASRRVTLATDRSDRSLQSSTQSMTGSGLMWMPASDTVPPGHVAQRDGHELAHGREHHSPVARRGRQLVGGADPGRTELARRRWPSARVST